MVYGINNISNNMDGYDDGDTMMCCGVEREEIYMGGGLLVYKCHTCGSRMETNKI